MVLFLIAAGLFFLSTFHVMPTSASEEDEDTIIFSDVSEDLDNAPGFDTEPEKEDWKFSLGAVVGVKPDYKGSIECSRALVCSKPQLSRTEIQTYC